MSERFIYFARITGEAGPIKIGCSSYPNGRCKQLGSDLAASIEIMATAPGDYLLERNLHLKFAGNRVNGPARHDRTAPVPGSSEWFAPTPELLALIATARRAGKIELPIEECRERAIAARYRAGETLQQIGDDYGITRERVRQILHSIGVKRRSVAETAYLRSLARRRRLAEWERRQIERAAA
jgi:hypothetical protein